MEQEEKRYDGYNGTLILTNTGAIITRGFKGFLLGGGTLRGDKSIPYSSIAAVQLKKAGLTAGYLQLSLMSGSRINGGLMQSAHDENSINFHHRGNHKFEEAKQLIEERIAQGSQPANRTNKELEAIEKLGELRNKGIITDTEFQIKKQQILGI